MIIIIIIIIKAQTFIVTVGSREQKNSFNFEFIIRNL